MKRSSTLASSFASGASASAEIDLGKEYTSVTLRMSAAEAAKLGTAADTSITVRGNDGVTFYPVYVDAMSGLQKFAKPASGAVQVTFQNVNGRYLKFATSVVTTGTVAFEVFGSELLTFEPAVERPTIR